MQRLAVLAVLLMLCAPLLSRWVQAHGPLPGPRGPAAPAHTTSGAAHAGMPGHAHADMAMAADTGAAAAMAMTMHAHAADGSADAATAAAHGSHGQVGDSHAAHGEACDYCLLAGRLLLVLAVAWLLLPPLHPPLPLVRRLLPVFVPVLRRAHAPRGPPLAA
nr:DUF2946 family protein [Stenotrophomonas sp. MMGLT7]